METLSASEQLGRIQDPGRGRLGLAWPVPPEGSGAHVYGSDAPSFITAEGASQPKKLNCPLFNLTVMSGLPFSATPLVPLELPFCQSNVGLLVRATLGDNTAHQLFRSLATLYGALSCIKFILGIKTGNAVERCRANNGLHNMTWTI